MTKYILHGGVESRLTDDNAKYFLEMTKSNSKQVKILCVYYAREEEGWGEAFSKDKESFENASHDKDLILAISDNDIEVFKNQIKENDVIYLRGGDTKMLMDKLSNIKDFKDLLDGKVLSGTSAGAYVISKYYYTRSEDSIEKGLGLIPIKVLVHYTEEMNDKFERLDAFEEKLPIYKIPEEQFVIIE